MDNPLKPSDDKNGSVNDRPLFIQNGSRGVSSGETEEITNFRRALPQFLAVSVKNILLFAYGMTLGFPTIVIPAVQGGEGREPSDIVLNREEISWFSSINLICVPLGCLFSGILTQPIGKRRAMQFVNLPILGSWLLFHFATRTEHLYAALCLSGLGGGLMEAPVLTYVAEITEPKYRGILSALGSTCVISGVFIQFILGSLMDWRTIAAVNSVFPVIAIIALCFVPESPTWLIREQRFREAIKALQWLRGWVPESNIEVEFNRLYDELITQPALDEAEESPLLNRSKFLARLRLFRKRSFVAPFLLVTFTFFAGHFSGKTTLQTYAVQIFHTLKAPINKYHATILLGISEMVATVLCVFLIHFTGKRPLVLISAIGVSVCFFGTATYAHYLKIVPGFAVNNVVVNASSIVPKESIISQNNITKIFETEERNLLVAGNSTHDDIKQSFDTKSIFEGDLQLMTTTPFTALLLPTESKYGELDDPEGTSRHTKRASTFIEGDTYSDNSSIIATIGQDKDIMTKTDIAKETVPQYKQPPKSSTESFSTVNGSSPTTREEANNAILLSVPQQEKNNLVYIPLVLLLGAAFFAHFGIRMIPWILIGEVFPAPVRSTASGLVSGLGYIFGFLANKFFLQMLSTLTLPGTFWLYAAVAFVAAIVLYFTLPETEGRTLAEIEAHFSKKSSTNLLKKSKPNKKPSIQMDNIQVLHMPIDPHTEAKLIKLQQSDLVPKPNLGRTNPAFEEHTTTHL